MTNMEALKAIFVALGGSEGDTASFKKLSDALEGISENVSGGGGGGGGGETGTFKLTWDYGDQDTPETSIETCEDIVDAMLAGKIVINTFNPQYYDPDSPQQLYFTNIITAWMYDEEEQEYLFFQNFSSVDDMPQYHATTLSDHLTVFS